MRTGSPTARGRRAFSAGFIPGLLLLAAFGTPSWGSGGPAPATSGPVQDFEENRGQGNPAALFLSRGSGYAVRIDPAGIDLLFPGRPAGQEADHLRLVFLGARNSPAVSGVDPLSHRVNYLAGSDPRGWITGVPTFAGVRYLDLYPGIDLTVRGDYRRLEIEFVLSPEADAASLALAIEGPDRIEVEGDSGDILLTIGGSEARLFRPADPGTGQPDSAAFGLRGGVLALDGPSIRPEAARRVRLALERSDAGAEARPGSEDVARVAVDGEGNTYVTGRALAAGIGDAEAFVTRIDRDGTGPRYTTYFGGGAEDVPLGLAVGQDQGVVLTGWTRSGDFPLARPLQPQLVGGSDAFVAKLAADGSSLVYSTYLGGEGEDESRGVAIDARGAAWIAGRTGSRASPMTAGPGSVALRGSSDGFVAALEADGSRLLHATLLGGSGDDAVNAIQVDRAGRVWVAGATTSSNFPGATLDRGAWPPGRQGSGAGTPPSGDAFLAALDRDGGGPVFTGHFGGSGDDAVTGLAVGPSGSVYLVGRMDSPDLPTTDGAPRPAFGGAGDGGGDGFVAVVHAGGDRPARLSYLGDGADDTLIGIAADAEGNAWIAGWTERAGPSATRGRRAFVARVAAKGGRIERFGGMGAGGTFRGTGIALDPEGRPIIVGFEHAGDSPAARVIGAASSAGVIVAVSGLDGAIVPDSAGCPGTIQFTNGAGTGLWQTAANWDLGRLPDQSDDVCIPAGSGVTLSSGAQAINTLFVETGGALTIAAGSLSVAAASQVDGSVGLSGGSLTGTGEFTVNGPFNWTGGLISGTGALTVQGTLSISGGTATRTLSQRTLTVGNTTWTSTIDLTMSNGAVIQSNGTWTFQSDTRLLEGTAPAPSFVNSGILRKSSGSGTSTVGVPYTGTGAVEVQTGTLTFTRNGTHAGGLTVSPGGTLHFAGGVHTLSPASSVSGDRVTFASGTVNVEGSYAVTGQTTVTVATVNVNPAATVTGLGALIINNNGVLNLNSGEAITVPSLTQSAGTLAGSDAIIVTGNMGWSAGTITGTGAISVQGTLSNSGSSAKTLSQRTLMVDNTTWTTVNTLTMSNGAVIQSNGTWDVQSDMTLFEGTAPAPSFVNAGILRKSSGSGTSTIGVPYTGTGSVEVQTGTLTFTRNGTHTGSLTVSTGATLAFGGGVQTLSGSLTVSPGGALNFAGGTYTLLPASSVSGDRVTFTSGTVNVEGSYAVTGQTVSSATVNVNPAATVSSLGALTLSAGTLNLNSGEAITVPSLTQSAGTLAGSDAITVTGNMGWSAGTIAGTGAISVQGTLTMSGSSARTLSQRTLTLGNTTWTTVNTLTMSNGAVIQSNGTWDFQNDLGILEGTAPAPSFVNAGILRKSSGSGISSIGVPYTGTGPVEVQSGTLTFTRNGTHAGSLTVSPGGTLNFAGGTHTLSPASSISGDRVTFTTGTVNVEGSYAVTGQTTVSGGATVNVNPPATVTSLGALTISGVLNLNSGEAITVPSLTQSAGMLAGSDAITVTGNMGWSGGTITGTGAISVQGTLSNSGSSAKTLSQRTLTLGNTTWTTINTLTMSNGAAIQSNGTWDVQSDMTLFEGTAPAPSFVNAGILRKSSGSGTSTVGVPYTGTGSVEVQTGTLTFTRNGSHAGSLTVSPGGTLTFNGGTHTLSPASSVSGDRVTFDAGTVNVDGSYAVAGQTTVSGATVNVNPAAMVTSLGALTITSGALNLNSGEAIAVLSLTQSAGTLAGSDPVTVTGNMGWSAGTITGTGSLTVQGGLSISGTSIKFLSQRPVVVGDTTWTGIGILTMSNGASLAITGTWETRTDADITDAGGATPSIDNLGTFRKTASSGLTTIGPSFVNSGLVDAQSGSLQFTRAYIQTAGTTRLGGGAMQASAGVVLQAGRLEGSGTLTGNVVSAGTVGPGLSSGVLTITGNYTQAGAGVYEVELGGLTPGSQHDQVVLSGTGQAGLDGTLEVALINGFAPADGDSFTIMSMSARTGTFATLDTPVLPSGLGWHVVYGNTSVVLSVGPVLTADLAIALADAPDPVTVGGSLRYTATVSSNGPDPAPNTIVTDILPSGMSFAGATTSAGSCGESSGTVTCNVGTVTPGQPIVIQIDVTPTQAAPSVGNTVSVDAEAFDAFPANNSATVSTRVEIPCPDADGDGAAICGAGCLARPGDVCGECNDSNPAIRPGIPESCNAIDDDCDAAVDEGLATAAELCNGLDENCNGLVDEGNPDGGAACTTGEAGVCGAGTIACLGGSLGCFRNAGPGPEACNGADDDCDGTADEVTDSDRDGVNDCADNCSDTFNPPSDCDGAPGTPDEQCDGDTDGVGDLCDCSPLDFSNPPPAEVGGTLQGTQSGATTQLTWGPVAGVTSYNVYRGYRMMGLPFSYNQQCLAGGVDALLATDTQVPRPLTVLYYMVASRCGDSTESVIGRNSSGSAVPRPFACPATERDTDGDGTDDAFDNCPGFRNPVQSDLDGDGPGDVCDNCPADSNPGQEDTDQDGAGDACDPP